MKTVRKIATNPIFSLLLISSLMFFSCQKDNLSSDTTIQKPKYDGETLFKGLAFMKGPAATNLIENVEFYSSSSEYKEATLNTQAQAFKTSEIEQAENTLIDKITDQIQKDDSTFFDRFQEEISSGDLIRVEAAMKEMGQRNYEAAMKMDELKPYHEQINEIANQDVSKYVDEEGNVDVSQLRSDVEQKFDLNQTNKTQNGSLVFALGAIVYVALAVDVAVVTNLAVAVGIYWVAGVFGPGINYKVVPQVYSQATKRTLTTTTLIKQISTAFVSTSIVKTSTSKVN